MGGGISYICNVLTFESVYVRYCRSQKVRFLHLKQRGEPRARQRVCPGGAVRGDARVHVAADVPVDIRDRLLEEEFPVCVG